MYSGHPRLLPSAMETSASNSTIPASVAPMASEPHPVRARGLARRPPGAGPNPEHRRADGEQDDGVGREGRVPEAAEEEREHRAEGELCCQQQ